MNKSDSGVRMGDLESAFGAIESIRRDVSANELKVVTLESRVKSLEKNHDGIRREIENAHKAITGKLDILIAEYHRNQGAKGLAKWLPTIITSIVGMMAIYTFINGGNQ